jgi:hypothetical protein
LNTAEKVQQDGKHVTAEDVSAARDQGASDLDIRDAVLIAAVFCMCKRHVDELGPGRLKTPRSIVLRLRKLLNTNTPE